MEPYQLRTVYSGGYAGVYYPMGSSDSASYSRVKDSSDSLYDNVLYTHVISEIKPPSQTSSSDAVDDIFEDRLGLIRSKLDLILLQLRRRKEINQHILYQIDYDSCRVQNLYFDLGDRAYAVGADRLTIEKLKLDLERQRRIEQVSYFRDTGMLNTDLKDTLIQYLEEVQKSEFLNGEDDE